MIRSAKLAVTCLWLLCIFWLVRFEAFPEFFSGSTLSYRNVINPNVLVQESWHKISIQGRDIGYVFSSVSIDNLEQQKTVDLESTIHINLGLPLRTDDILLESTIRLNPDYSVASVETDLSVPGIRIRNMIDQVEAGKYTATSFRADSQTTTSREITMSPSMIIFTPPTGFLPPRLRPGVKSYMRALDPVSFSVSTIEIETVTPGQGIGSGLARHHHWTRVTHKGLDFLCARNSEDEVITVIAPLGIILRKCTAEEALAAAGIGTRSSPGIELNTEKITQYVESLVGPLSSILRFKPETGTNNDQDQ